MTTKANKNFLRSWDIKHGNELTHKNQVDKKYHIDLRLFCEIQCNEEV